MSYVVLILPPSISIPSLIWDTEQHNLQSPASATAF
jgi:hypothetical protein